MVRSIVGLAALLLAVAGAQGEVDFTPRESFYMVEGTKVPNIAFHNGTKDLKYTPPGGWALRGGGRRLVLTPDAIAQAEAVMQTAPMKVPLPATEDNLKAYSDLAIGLLPGDASKVVVEEMIICSLQFSGKSMAEVTLSYVLFGQPFSTNVLFLPYDKETITFQLTARTADFATLSKAFRASLYSLHGL